MRTLLRPTHSEKFSYFPLVSENNYNQARFRAGAIGRWSVTLARGPFWLPGLIGTVTYLAIAALATTLLRDGLMAYAVLAVSGLVGIFYLESRDRRRQGKTPLSLVRVSLDSALHSLAQIAESRDQELSGHSERVARNAVAIGNELGVHKHRLEELWWAGLLHDVGKIGLPESILNKPGPLTEDEKREVQKHPEYGAEIVSPFCSGFPAITDAIRFHHERWDGLGYPSGLSRNQIPLFARIVAVADVFEALTSQRPYRAALTAEQAAIYIRRESGTHFAPDVVKAFDVMHRSGALYVAPAGRALQQSGRTIVSLTSTALND